jgi:septal ring factor EnvC (AmiA/AmiB activator)
MKKSKALRTMLKKVEAEINDLLVELKAGTLDRKKLKSGLKDVQRRMKEMDIHNHEFDVKDR